MNLGIVVRFCQTLLETPRTVSFVSEEQIRLFGVSTGRPDAWYRALTPLRVTACRGINVRVFPRHYRGMKRLNQQGHAHRVVRHGQHQW
jgi:hypothetical protein